MPQLLNCFFQPFFLLYLILFSSYLIFCDLQRGKKRKPSWPMVHSHSDPAVFRVTDVLLLSCPVVWAGRPAALGAESYQDVADPIFTGRMTLFPLSWSFSAMLTVEIWTYSGGYVGAVPTGLWPVTWEPPWKPGWGLLSLVNEYVPSASLLCWLVRYFAQCLDSYEQFGKCVGDWRQKGGLWTHWSSAMLFDQE